MNGGAYHTCDETHTHRDSSSHSAALCAGEPCRSSLKRSSNHNSDHPLSHFIDTFTHYTRRRQGSKTNGFPVPSSRCPRRLRRRNSVMLLMSPRGTRVSHVRFPQTRYSFCFRCRRLCPTILIYPWQREQDEMRPGFTRNDRRWFCPVMIWEILVENTHRDTAHPGEIGTILVQYLTGPQRG